MSRYPVVLALIALALVSTAVQAQDTFCWRDHGTRGPGQLLDPATQQCAEGLEWSQNRCYPPCEGGAEGIGYFCWGRCPSSMPFECGTACAATPDDCTAEIQEMLVRGTRMAVDVVPFGRPPFDVEAAMNDTAEALAQAAAKAPASNATSSVEFPGLRETVKALLQDFLSPTSGVIDPAKVGDYANAGSLAGHLLEVNAEVDGGWTGGHTLALMSTQMTDEQLDALISGLTLILVDERIQEPRGVLSSLPVKNPFAVLNFVDSFRHENCSGYPNGGTVAEYLSINPEEHYDDHSDPSSEDVRDALGLLNSNLPNPAGDGIISGVKGTLNKGNLLDILGPETTPELVDEIMARFERGKLLEGNAVSTPATDMPPPRNKSEALHLCMASYSKEGQCDWQHWSEMYEVCRLYEHPPLDDAETIAAIKAGQCTWSNWSNFAKWLQER